MRLRSLTLLLLFLAFASCVTAQDRAPAAENPWGVYTWGSWDPRKITSKTYPHIKGVPIILKWDDVEPNPGDFRFESELGERLEALAENDFRTFIMLWVVPSSPRWLYENGVSKVDVPERVNPARRRVKWDYPHYLDPDYKRYFHRLINEFGRYVLALPDELRERIVFLQIAEGSTGDGQPYKGVPTDPRYAITREQWSDFRIETWDVYKKAFSRKGVAQIPFLVNNDANRSKEHAWLLANLDTIGFKQGMFSHGYHISDTQKRIGEWRAFSSEARALGKATFSRGEQDAEWNICGWSKKNPRQAFYWSALFALHCGLDLWNVPRDACQGEELRDALEFFNKYAGKNDPALSPGAFCALRRGLDASDTALFPEAEFGKAKKSNIERYLKIAARFAERGAIQGDPRKATGGGMLNRQRDDYNDVGWGIVPGNYQRFLEQIDPASESLGWWHAEPSESIFSRFARSFDHASGKTAMRFRLDENFFPQTNQTRSVTIRIVYLDQGKGQWALAYNTARGEKIAETVRCQNTGQWLEKKIPLPDARFNQGLPHGADLVLKHQGGDDTIFHLIELER